MGHDTEVTLTHLQGQAITRYLGLRWPKEFSPEEKFDIAEQAIRDDEIMALRIAIRSYSQLVQTEKKWCFGKAANWAKIDTDQYRLINPDATVKVRLKELEADGLYDVLELMAHPGSPMPCSVADLEEVVWPVARALKWDRQLAKDIKLSHKNRKRRIIESDSPEWDKEEPKGAEPKEEPKKGPPVEQEKVS